MKVMENGVLEATKLISEARKEGQVIKEATVLQIASILSIGELNDYQEVTLRTWNNKTDFGGRVSNAALGLTGEAGEVADIVKKQFITDMVSNHRIVQEKRTETLIN